MLRVGITGGIGSGKTTVAKIFAVLGVPVYYADVAAKRLMNEDASLQLQMKSHFGEAIFQDGVLNRSLLASQVFNDQAQLNILNSLVHPATIADAECWMIAQTSTDGQLPKYALKEAALIFESGANKKLDYVIGVHAPYRLRLQRAMQRDDLSKEAVEIRMEKQMDESKKLKFCDFIISNDEENLLIPQVLELHKKLLTIGQ